MDRKASLLLMVFGTIVTILYFRVVRHPFLGFAAFMLLLLPLGAAPVGKLLAGNTH